MTSSDPPPAYHSLQTTDANVTTAEETVAMPEDDTEILLNNSFEDKTTRLGFIQKVLTIKLLQFLGVIMIMTIFVANENYRGFIYYMRREDNYIHMFVLSTFAYIVTLGLLIHCDKIRRTDPYRYVFLVAYPLSYTFLICFIMTWWQLPELSAAWYYYSMALFALLVYCIFASQTKLEFVTRYASLVGCLLLIVAYALTVLFFYVNAFYVLYLTIAVCLDICHLLFNLEMMTSKHYRFIITPDDFVDGALNLHIDFYYIIVNTIVPKVKNAFDKFVAQVKISMNETN